MARRRCIPPTEHLREPPNDVHLHSPYATVTHTRDALGRITTLDREDCIYSGGAGSVRICGIVAVVFILQEPTSRARPGEPNRVNPAHPDRPPTRMNIEVSWKGAGKDEAAARRSCPRADLSCVADPAEARGS